MASRSISANHAAWSVSMLRILAALTASRVCTLPPKRSSIGTPSAAGLRKAFVNVRYGKGNGSVGTGERSDGTPAKEPAIKLEPAGADRTPSDAAVGFGR